MTDPEKMTKGPDWTALARKFELALAENIHRPEGQSLHGLDLYAHALESVFGHPLSGFTATEEHMRLIRMHQGLAEAQQQTHRREIAEQRERHDREMADAGRYLADRVRQVKHNVKGKMRQEGIEWCLKQIESK